jgi:hypothetical protein
MPRYAANVKVWAGLDGNARTPLLLQTVIYFECEDHLAPRIAEEEVRHLIRTTPRASSGHFELVGYWNQNLRDRFVAGGLNPARPWLHKPALGTECPCAGCAARDWDTIGRDLYIRQGS